MNHKQRLRKIKNKEETAKNRVLARRIKLRASDKKTKEEELQAKRFQDKQVPYVKADHPIGGVVLPNNDSEKVVKNRLKKHIKALEKMEQEIYTEDEMRRELNEVLEKQGITDVQAKLEALSKMNLPPVQEKVKKSRRMKGSAKSKFSTNE